MVVFTAMLTFVLTVTVFAMFAITVFAVLAVFFMVLTMMLAVVFTVVLAMTALFVVVFSVGNNRQGKTENCRQDKGLFHVYNFLVYQSGFRKLPTPYKITTSSKEAFTGKLFVTECIIPAIIAEYCCLYDILCFLMHETVFRADMGRFMRTHIAAPVFPCMDQGFAPFFMRLFTGFGGRDGLRIHDPETS
ncbi:hypothetical protein MSKU15_0972 [Komagataeibacter diospyri]|nr:hypothetical protein MSKU15_0972 [Komagataeibacter diospyri]